SSRRDCILPRFRKWSRAALMRSACAPPVTSHMVPCSVSHLGQLTSRASAVLWSIVSFPSSLCIYIVAPPVYTRNPTPTPTQPPHRRGPSHAQEPPREYLLPRRVRAALSRGLPRGAGIPAGQQRPRGLHRPALRPREHQPRAGGRDHRPMGER